MQQSQKTATLTIQAKNFNSNQKAAVSGEGSVQTTNSRQVYSQPSSRPAGNSNNEKAAQLKISGMINQNPAPPSLIQNFNTQKSRINVLSQFKTSQQQVKTQFLADTKRSEVQTSQRNVSVKITTSSQTPSIAQSTTNRPNSQKKIAAHNSSNQQKMTQDERGKFVISSSSNILGNFNLNKKQMVELSPYEESKNAQPVFKSSVLSIERNLMTAKANNVKLIASGGPQNHQQDVYQRNIISKSQQSQYHNSSNYDQNISNNSHSVMSGKSGKSAKSGKSYSASLGNNSHSQHSISESNQSH